MPSNCHHNSKNAVWEHTDSNLDANRIFVSLSNHAELAELYNAHDYTWDTLEEGIPPLVLQSFPGNPDEIYDLKKKKRTFFMAILPIALLSNEKILLQREQLMQIFEKKDQGKVLSASEEHFIETILKSYNVSGDPLNTSECRRELLKKVDIIPPALVLAQAASESAYGTSRFSRLANNLFGEWTFIPGAGIVPQERPAGKTYEVRRFQSISASLNSYLNNLNTHRAYKELREKRAYLRSKGLPLKATELADGLFRYSIQGQKYVESIKKIIRHNRLSRLSQTKLRIPENTQFALDTGNPAFPDLSAGFIP